jgi:hypothetical protein
MEFSDPLEFEFLNHLPQFALIKTVSPGFFKEKTPVATLITVRYRCGGRCTAQETAGLLNLFQLPHAGST